MSTIHSQSIVPALPPDGRVPHILRPYAPNLTIRRHSISHLATGHPPLDIGIKGRRGISSSVRARGTAALKTQAPEKDADGRFPCSQCTKTYVAAKHLNRHMITHTGERPHVCTVCGRAFARRDSLKRHSRKCVVRHGSSQGNTTEASQLSFTSGRTNQAEQSATETTRLKHYGHIMNGIHNATGKHNIVLSATIPTANQLDHMNNQYQASCQSCRDDTRDEEQMGMFAPILHTFSQQQQLYNHNSLVSIPIEPNPPNNSQNNMSMFGGGFNQHISFDWQTMFTQGNQVHYAYPFSPEA
ncbi:hypothetical protein F5883DRAFT_476278 [Diaporthe sp. PMI_573]|nr:hypothetical protein F5883DRAFT_476278 [Diaporthaceae sp. PMI_573]